MYIEFRIDAVHTSSDLFRTRIKSGEGVQYPVDFTQTFDNPSEVDYS